MMEVARVLRLDLLIKLSLAVFLGGIIGVGQVFIVDVGGVSAANRPASEPTS